MIVFASFVWGKRMGSVPDVKNDIITLVCKLVHICEQAPKCVQRLFLSSDRYVAHKPLDNSILLKSF